MGDASHETPLQRRLRELEEEEKALRQNMKLLERQTRALAAESADLPRAASRSGPRIASTVPRPGYGGDADAHPPAVEQAADVAAGDAGAPPAPAPGGRGAAAQRPPAKGDERFASYFASGSFGRTRPLGHERRVQRNKAIFMVVFVVIVAYVMYRILFR